MTVTGYLESGESLVTSKTGSERVLLVSPWEDGDGQLHAATLRVVLPVERPGLAKKAQRLSKGAVVAVDASTLDRPVAGGGWNAAAQTVRRATPSQALKDFRRRLEEPVVLSDVVLGHLRLERRFGWYLGRCRLATLSCDITVKRSSLEEDRKSDRQDVETARIALLQLEQRLDEIVSAAATELHGIWDRSWRDGRPALTTDELRRRLSVQSIDFSPTRHTVCLDAGDLFLGHGVEVRLSPSGEINEVGLVG